MEEFAYVLSLFRWFQLRPGPPPEGYWALVGLYALGLGASAAYFVTVRQRFGDHSYRMATARRVGLSAGIVSAFGLIFVALRFLEIPYLSLRLWVNTITLGAVGLGLFLAYYFVRKYPVSLHAFDERQLRERYLPKPKPKAKTAGGSRPRRRAR